MSWCSSSAAQVQSGGDNSTRLPIGFNEPDWVVRSLAVPTWLSLLLPPPLTTSSRAPCPVQLNYAKYLPRTTGRYAAKAFRKAQCPIVEGLTNALMMHGAFLCSSCETTLS